jgi:hypothetical protein
VLAAVLLLVARNTIAAQDKRMQALRQGEATAG